MVWRFILSKNANNPLNKCMGSFICEKCGNTDMSKVGFINGKPYCRACILFPPISKNIRVISPKPAHIYLDYELTDDQNLISRKLVHVFQEKKNSFVNAVCGSGKTEIVLNCISYCIEHGLTVGFAVPRRDVAIELHQRFSQIFKDNLIALVHGGHHDLIYGDLICLTTHQLFRYPNYFDLLIMDEVDAFPYKDNYVLNSFFKKAVKGNYILLSATPTEEFLTTFSKEGGVIFSLFARHHKNPLPVPIIKKRFFVFTFLTLYLKVGQFIKEGKPIFIFTPTIDLCESVFTFLHLFYKKGFCVHSKKNNRKEIIEDFKNGKLLYLVTTAVLERGVTIRNLQVIVFKSDHRIYDRYALIQIAGRVGRKKETPSGEVIFIANQVTKEMECAIKEIERNNKLLQNLLQKD